MSARHLRRAWAGAAAAALMAVAVVTPTGAADGSIGAPVVVLDPPGAWVTGGWVWAEWTVEYEGTLAGFAVALDAEPDTDPGTVPTQVEPYWEATLPDGEYWLHVRGVLEDGSAGATTHVRILADSTPPQIGQLSGPSLSVGNVTDSSTVPVAWSVEPDLSGIAGYDLQLLPDGEPPFDGDDPTLALDGTATSVALEVPHEGVWGVYLRPVDTAGNVGEFARLGFAFDGEPPGPVTVTGSHADGQPTGQRRLVMSFESAWEDHVEAWAAHIDGSPDSVPDPASASPEGRITGLVDVGESWLHVSARDVLGRWGPVTHVRLVVRDDPYALEVSAGESFWAALEIVAVCEAANGAGLGVVRPGSAAVRVADLTSIGDGRCSAVWDTGQTVDEVRLWPDGEYELVVVDATDAEVSDRVPVKVAAAATVVDRLQADYEAGLVSSEDLALGLLAGLTHPGELPERYAAAERETPSAAALVAALMAGGGLSPEAARLLTPTGDVESLVGVPATAGFPDVPGEGVDSITHGGGGYSESCGLEFWFLDESFACAARSEHFWVFYHPGEVGPDAQGGIGSEFVERIVVSLERARAVYAEEGFAVPALDPLVFLSPAMPSGTGISLPFMRDGGGRTVLPVILMSSDWTENSQDVPRVPEYLPHHEYFHQVQYQYFPAALRLTGPFDNPYWWMEATAEWGAHLVQKSRFDFTHRGAYSRQLDKFLDRSRQFYDVGSAFSAGGPEYGAFVLAEYLGEEHGGPGAIARTWELIGRLPFGQSPAGAIEDVIVESGNTYADAIHQFREWTYPLERVQGRDVGFADEDARSDGFWRQRLEPGYRPPHAAVQVTNDAREVSGTVSLSAGGAEYVEISGPLGPVGELEIEVSSPTGHDFRASVIDQVDEFPSLCPYYPSRAAEPPGVGSAPGQAVISGVIDTPPSAVVGGDSCGNAVLVITNTTPMPAPRIAGLEAGAGDFAWSVTFRPLGAQLLEGMLSVGVTHGGTLGYEFESVVAGALREPALWDSWGVSEGALGGGVESYYRYRAEFLGDLRPESFVFSQDAAVAVTRLGTLEITHEIAPSSDPRMWQVDVTVARLPGTPPTGQPVVYRRAMAWWDRYSTYFTWARAPGGGDGSVLALVDSRWDPVPPTQGVGTRGYVDRVGPLNNPAGTIDLDLGHVTSGSPARFTLYFGMAPTPAAAVASVLGVSGDVYSLVESSRTQYTAVFAWREG